MDENLREVNFYGYCKRCKYEELPENEWPCWECLECPITEATDKPVNFKEKETKKGTRSR